MTNNEKRIYITSICEYHRQCYNNGEIDNIVGQLESHWYQLFLKCFLLTKKLLKLSYKYHTKNNW